MIVVAPDEDIIAFLCNNKKITSMSKGISTNIPFLMNELSKIIDMGHSQGGGDNFEKCSVKIIPRVIVSTNYFFHTRLLIFSIIYN